MKRPYLILVTTFLAFFVGAACVPAAFGADPVALTAGNGVLFQTLASASYVTGRVYNGTASPVVDVTLKVSFRNASNAVIGSQACPVGVHVLDDATYTYYTQPVSPPAGTTSCTFTATGVPVAAHAHKALVAPLPTQNDFGIGRSYSGVAQNPSGFESIAGLLVYGDEWLSPPQFYDAAVDANHVTSVIGPGATHDYSAYSLRMTVQSVALSSLWYEWVGYDPNAVYRFYNKRIGSHFYTASIAERDSVIAHLSSTYNYEGVAYQVNAASPSNMQPLYRFYNKRTGSHFYTASPTERDNVIATLSSTYNFEGTAYQVSAYPWYSQPVYRFFNKKNGTHFYTVSAAEKTNVQNTLSATYRYEGVGFYLAY